MIDNLIPIVAVAHTGFTSVFKLFDKEEYNHIDLDKIRGVDPDDIKLDETKMNIAFGNIMSKINIVKYLNELSKVIIPIRDPLLSIISTYARQTRTNLGKPPLYSKANKPASQNVKGSITSANIIIPSKGPMKDMSQTRHIGAPHSGIRGQLFGWELWANHIYGIKPFHVPLDLGVSNLVYRDIEFKNIGIHNSINSLVNQELKKAYNDRDLLYIVSELGGNFHALVRMESILRPPLEELGYKDLLWWDK